MILTNILELVMSLIRGRKVMRQAAMIPTWDSTNPQTDMEVIAAVEISILNTLKAPENSLA